MKIHVRSILRAITLVTMVTFPATAWAGAAPWQSASAAEQGELAKQLLSDNQHDQKSAFWRVYTIEPSTTEPVLRDALINLLLIQNRVVNQPRQQGVTVDQVEDPEFIGAVQEVVARFNDPEAIPALAGSLNSGGVTHALSRFGERALPAVLSVVQSSSDHYAVDNGLRAVRWMIENRDSSPLSPHAIEEIRRTAAAKLRGEVYFTTLWNAIDLAASLQDSELLQIVAELATDPLAIVARGVTDPSLVGKTQERAAQRIRGVQPTPRGPRPATR